MLIFIDFETTGVETTDTLCSVAILYENNYLYSLVNEGKKIPASASAIHHITNEMIKDKDSFSQTSIYDFLKQNNDKDNTLIMHNAEFHSKFIASVGLVWQGDIIDTLRVSKHLMPECDSFSLQNLRYELKLYREEEKQKQSYGIKDALYAHHALSDVLVLQLLFQSLEELEDITMMIALSSKNVLLQKLSFGKYKERYIEEICLNDRAYIEWLFSTTVDEDMRYTLDYYLQG